VIDLSALIRRKSRLDGHPPAPPYTVRAQYCPGTKEGERRETWVSSRKEHDGWPVDATARRDAILERVLPENSSVAIVLRFAD
jgi:hypothetical protein